ncbi:MULTISPECIES: cupin domain-containing protein [unclassified Pseudomonas]|uniref:cupin domain-containing protein n=1 Tax=unclassified Pseudomonas TaxID=196821 RepID=UPI000C869856|nr:MULTISPECIES: cupin domain-containing protein [unclassified Pseudomonas]PMV22735.1 cupin [Pseudomonas sp. FW305-3-2-15-C-TSA2]PMV29398.1 cupin [Pseudomonas sp. DP16D-L5]PMV39301.1 cupin [Pseudomonas sp. FW305-3-2-15-A-LB2]PMV45611.1 cupin [Pseudomonas sp. FW305-3-2-15-C-R2A1]PMV51946.1 cupin [Pseudomonas sp. FW305-3-2-15-C-LB1]
MSSPRILLLARADGSRVPTPFKSAALGELDPFGETRQIAWQGDDGVSAGLVSFSGNSVIDSYPYSETLVVHAGSVVLNSATLTLELGVGDCAVIGLGTRLTLQASSDSQWAFCAVDLANVPARPGLTLLAPHTQLNPSAAPEPQILIGPTPQCRALNLFDDASTELRVGLWDSTPYARHGRPHKLHELMYLLEGSVTLQDDADTTVTVGTGDTVFVAKGAPCAWSSAVYVRKVYAVK